MTTPDESQPTLPGLELGEHVGSLRAAVITTLEALQLDGLLEPRHAMVAQLALEMADAVQRGIAGGKASAAAMAGAQLLAAYQALPQPLAADAQAAFRDFVLALERDVNGAAK